MALMPVPSGLMVHRLSVPLRSLMNAICFPSGDHLGMQSHVIPLVIRFAVPPLIGRRYRSPRRSKTRVWPSGETSRETHVPSSVSKEIFRDGLSGSATESADAARAIVLALPRFALAGSSSAAKDTVGSAER